MTPLILRLVARYGPKILKYMSKQAPSAIQKVAPSMASSMEAFRGLKRISPQMLSGARNLMKEYPLLFNSTSSRVNHGNAMQLYKALKKFKGPDLRKTVQSPPAIPFKGGPETNIRLFRGVPTWYKKQMVRGGRHKGPTHYADLDSPGKNWIYKKRGVPIRPGSKVLRGGSPDMLHTAPSRKYAEHAARAQRGNINIGVDRFGNPIKYEPRVLEYNIPFKDILKYSKGHGQNFRTAKDILNANEVVFPRGLPKQYLRKVHKLLDK